MKFRFLALVACLCGIASIAAAQAAGGTITGSVTDPTGAVLANAKVTATQVETGTVTATVTSDTGTYSLPQIRVGEYSIVVEQPGFKTARRTGVKLDQAQTIRVDVSLEVGASADSITVSADSSMLHTENGQLVTNLSPAQIQNLPLLPITASFGFIRDPFALGNTVPGVLQSFTNTRVNGLGQSTIQYRLEGEVLGNIGAAGITTRTQPSPDAIEEVAVQTSNIPVEFGSASGAVFNVSIKSGTNKFHGTAYDTVANEAFNAYDPASHTRNRIRRHDYGFNIGGPVKIPFLYNGENKSFFFFNWEQFRDSQKSFATPIATVPTDAYRKGDFSGLFAASGGTNLRVGPSTLSNGQVVGVHDYVDPLGHTIPLGTIFDPSTKQTVICTAAAAADCTLGATLSVRTAFPGNIIPTALIDPVAAKILSKYIPLPNVSTSLINNYSVPIPTSRITSSPALKFDQNVGSKMRVSFTYSQNKTTSAVQTAGLAEGFPEPATGNSGTYEQGPSYRVNFDYTVRPTISYHLGLGYSIYEFATRPLTTDYNAFTDIGLKGALENKNFPYLNLSPLGSTTNPGPPAGGLYRLGTTGQTALPERRPSISQNLTWVRGNHTFKFGGDFRQDMLVTASFTNANGNYSFSNTGVTWNPSLQGVTGFVGNSNVGFNFANFLLGSVNNVTLAAPLVYRRSKQQWGTFAQDSWRVRRNLTVDFGVRWDYGTYTKEDYGRLGALSLTVPNTSAGGHPGGLIYEATCGCHFAQNYPFAIGPRLGMAYTLNPKTVIRGGIALAYGSTPVVSGAAQNSANSAAPAPGDDAFKLKDGIPSSIAPVWPVYVSGQGLPVGSTGGAPTIIDPNAGRPDRTLQWNLSLQREVTRNLVVEASYVANRGAWQPTGGFQDFNSISQSLLNRYGFNVGNLADAAVLTGIYSQQNPAVLAAHGVSVPYSNFPTTTATVLQALKPFPQYTTGVSPQAPMGRSWYDALQITVTKRYSHGLDLTANYTYSKNLVYASSPDIYNLANGKDVANGANFNPPQVLRIAFSYTVQRPNASTPFLGNKYVALAVKDWQLGAAMFYQTANYLGRPSSNGTNPISKWLGRGPGSAQLKQNADGSYMNPWSVDWTDNSGQHHTDPLDINCHCFDPEKTQVLNPAAWANIPDGTWGAQTAILTDFRGARRPSESANFARNFRFGRESRFNLQTRIEFTNIFNRMTAPNPTLGNFTTPITQSADGRNISGFGAFGNLRAAGTLGTPRAGQFIARITF